MSFYYVQDSGAIRHDGSHNGHPTMQELLSRPGVVAPRTDPLPIIDHISCDRCGVIVGINARQKTVKYCDTCRPIMHKEIARVYKRNMKKESV